MPIEIVICSKCKRGHWPIDGQGVPVCRDCLAKGVDSKSNDLVVELNDFNQPETNDILKRMAADVKKITDEAAIEIGEIEGRHIWINVQIDVGDQARGDVP